MAATKKVNDILRILKDPSHLSLITTPQLQVRPGSIYHELTNKQDINSIYKQNISENSDQSIHKVYSIPGLEDPVKEIKTDYNHNELSKLID